ncbi:Uncharacterised protein [Mycobacteroides abscessus subsp. abscessus]|nr:Uncharacterised protein [Mycobacteroides abscessus subsp. abscessus]
MSHVRKPFRPVPRLADGVGGDDRNPQVVGPVEHTQLCDEGAHHVACLPAHAADVDCRKPAQGDRRRQSVNDGMCSDETA